MISAAVGLLFWAAFVGNGTISESKLRWMLSVSPTTRLISRSHIELDAIPAYAGYALLLSPNQTPYRDMYFLEKLTGLGVEDGVQINAVFTQLFFMMGLWPAIYAALLVPSARSGNKVRIPCMCFGNCCPSTCLLQDGRSCQHAALEVARL